MSYLSCKCTEYNISHFIPSILFWGSQGCTKFEPQAFKSSRTQLYFKLINDGVNVARQKIFLFLTVKWQLNVLLSQTIVLHAEKSKQLCLFSHCFWNSNSCFQIKPRDSISNLSYQFYHKCWKIAILDWGQAFLFHTKAVKSQRNRGGYLNIFRLLCFKLSYSKALVWFCCSLNLQSPIFCKSVF